MAVKPIRKHAKQIYPKIKVAKISNTTINQPVIATNHKFKDAELVPDLITGELMPYPVEFIKKVAEDAITYFIEEPRALNITQYIVKRRIQFDTWYNWCDKYDWFKRAHNNCLMIIGNKREVGASFRELDREMQLRQMHRFWPEWKAVELHNKELNQKEEEKPTAFNIYLGRPDVVEYKPDEAPKIDNTDSNLVE
jgi:hypothetical protein